MDEILQNTVVDSKNIDLKIICAILNKYGKRFMSESGHEEAIAERVLSRMDVPHKLLSFIKQYNLTAKLTVFKNFDPQTRRFLTHHSPEMSSTYWPLVIIC